MRIDEIYWGRDESVEIYARGHVDKEDFAAEHRRRYGSEVSAVDVKHMWGRWVPDSTKRFDRRLITVDGPERGAFKFTIVDE